MTQEEFDYLRDMLKARSGLVLGDEKRYLLESRLMPVARELGLENLSGLVSYLKTDLGNELRDKVTQAMTINESFFFRDKTPFENFKNIMVPELLKTSRAASRKLKIWCAAASTGQEPYSLAILIKEMGAQFAGWNIEIIATDLSEEVLEKAKAGLYSQFEVQRGLPIQLMVKYFQQTGSMWQIDSAIRSMVTYKHFNLLDDYIGLGAFDIIFCRNVLIYFDPTTKSDMLARMANQMLPDGYLVLGAAETVIGISDHFKPVTEARGLYSAVVGEAAKIAAPARAAVGAAPVTPARAILPQATPAAAPAPVISTPAAAPVTPAPAVAPATPAPVAAPVTPAPAAAPVTPVPAAAPATPAPVAAPVTPAPAVAPVTRAPVVAPSTPAQSTAPTPPITPVISTLDVTPRTGTA